MFEKQTDDLSAHQTLTHVAELRSASERMEAMILEAAGHWADLHGVVDSSTVSLPGMEKLRRLGGEGTPEVAEFAPAELGAELGISPYAGRLLVADALDLRHRLPTLWQRIQAGEVKPWIGRKVAQATRPHDLVVAAQVDAKVAPWADRVTWGRLESMVDAAIIAADPEKAEHEAAERRGQHGVWVNRSNDHETATAFVRGDTVDLKFFDASLDRVADGIGLLGDTDSKDVRRAKAIGILANPQRALDLYDATAAAARIVDRADLPADVPASDGLAEADAYGANDPGTPRDIQPPTDRTRRHRVDPRPPATLYVHLSQEALVRGTGVARVEGIRPVTLDQATSWLGHCHVTVRPVLDPLGIAPVDAYEIPDRMREAVHLLMPTDVFPHASSTRRKTDIDHTEPYIPPDEGGPPGQTGIGNLGPSVRFHHRIKTHGGWQVRQPYPGIFIWRSPHGRHWLVDHTGTRRLPTAVA